MGFFPFQFAKGGVNGVPVVRSAKYKTSEALVKGSILIIDGNGELNLATSDGTHPADATIVGVAMEPAGSKPGWDIGQSDSNSQYTGRVQEVSYVVANRMTEFWGIISGDGTTVTTPTQAIVGIKYKVTKASDGTWYVDSTDQSPASVQITDIDLEGNRVIFKFTEASLFEP